MILGVGTDLISVNRIQNLIFKFKEKFEEKIFTPNEIAKAQKIKISDDDFLPRAKFYAKRFAAKEAFSKALGLGIGRGVDFKDIEIDNDHLENRLFEFSTKKKNSSKLILTVKISQFTCRSLMKILWQVRLL